MLYNGCILIHNKYIFALIFIDEEFEDIKGVLRIHKSMTDRQCNGKKKRDKRTNNDQQNITHKTKDRVTRTPLKPGVKSGAPDMFCTL